MNKLKLFSDHFVLFHYSSDVIALLPLLPPPTCSPRCKPPLPLGFHLPLPPNDATPDFNFPTAIPHPEDPSGASTVPLPSTSDQLPGHIVFTCQLFKVQAMDQICIMNADGSGMRRLTTENNRRHYYRLLAPDGQSVLYSSFREENVYEIYSSTSTMAVWIS